MSRRTIAAVGVSALLALQTGHTLAGVHWPEADDDGREEVQGRVALALAPFMMANPCTTSECGLARLKVIDDVTDACVGEFDMSKQIAMTMALAHELWTVPGYKAGCPERLLSMAL